jgi:hypothetical protein
VFVISIPFALRRSTASPVHSANVPASYRAQQVSKKSGNGRSTTPYGLVGPNSRSGADSRNSTKGFNSASRGRAFAVERASHLAIAACAVISAIAAAFMPDYTGKDISMEYDEE